MYSNTYIKRLHILIIFTKDILVVICKFFIVFVFLSEREGEGGREREGERARGGGVVSRLALQQSSAFGGQPGWRRRLRARCTRACSRRKVRKASSAAGKRGTCGMRKEPPIHTVREEWVRRCLPPQQRLNCSATLVECGTDLLCERDDDRGHGHGDTGLWC